MKTSLLLVALAAGAAVSLAAHAADAGACHHAMHVENGALAAATSAMLPALGKPTAAHHHARATRADRSRATAATGVHAHQPGPADTRTSSQRHGSGENSHPPTTDPHARATTVEQKADDSGEGDSRPTLGWQSLLPGSIQ